MPRAKPDLAAPTWTPFVPASLSFVIPTSRRVTKKTIAADALFSFDRTPSEGRVFSLAVINSTAAPVTVTLPECFSVNAQAAVDTFEVGAYGREFLTFVRVGSEYWLHGEPDGASLVGDVTAPTLVSATINAAGTNLALVFSEAVDVGTDALTGLLLNPTGADVTLSYASGYGTTTINATISRAILQTSEETAVLGFTKPTDGIADIAGNALENFSGFAVTNNSTQTAGGGGGGAAWAWSVDTGELNGNDAVETAYFKFQTAVALTAGTVSKLAVNIRNFTYAGNLKVQLFSPAGALLGTGTVNVTATGDAEVNVTPVAVSTGNHSIGYISDAGYAMDAGVKTSGSAGGYKSGFTYASPPSSLPSADGALTGQVRVGAYVTP